MANPSEQGFSRMPRASTQAGRWPLAVAIVGSALAVGTVHTATLCVVTAVLAIAGALAWWKAEPMRVRPAATTLLFTGIALTLYTAFQCIPLPVRVLAVIAPHNADVWSRALMPLHEAGPAWAPITLDPVATRVEVLRGVAYLLAFVVALRVARQREGLRFLSGVIVLTGLALAAAALLHPAFGAHKLFGIYEPGPGIEERHVAPLLNPNNLAGYLNIALCLALAVALAPEPSVPRPIAGAIVLVLVATQIWVASRGGVVTMVLGIVVVVAIVRIAHSERRGAVATLSLVTGAAVAIGGVLIVIGASEDAATELWVPDASKLQMLPRMMRMLPAMPIFGCGRGAFESAFPAFRTDAGFQTFAYPENVVAQWILEWGLPVGLAALVAVAVALRPSAVLARSTTAPGAWAAIVAITVQNIVDLGSEIPGLVIAGTVCAAIVVAGTPGHRPRWRIERWARRPRRVAIVGVAAAGVALLLAAEDLGGGLHDDQRRLHEAVFRPRVSAATMRVLARAAMLRHPAEPYLPFITALRASQAGDENPIPWVAATLERASVYGLAHLVLARSMIRRSPSQARLEYRLAMEQQLSLVGIASVEAPRLVGGYFDAMELVPKGKDAVQVLDALVMAVKHRLPATSVRLDAELEARAPTMPGPALRAADDAVDDIGIGATAAPWCEGLARTACVHDAVDKATRAVRLAPDLCAPRVVHARARVANGDVIAGLSELAEAADVVSDRVSCLKALVELADEVNDERRATDAIDKLANAGCSEDSECASNLAWGASAEEGRGNQRRALALYRHAHERAPEQDGPLESIARLAGSLGLHAEAADAYRDLARRHPGEPRWTAGAEAERAAAVKAAVSL